jgi:hypothetical protein
MSYSVSSNSFKCSVVEFPYELCYTYDDFHSIPIGHQDRASNCKAWSDIPSYTDRTSKYPISAVFPFPSMCSYVVELLWETTNIARATRNMFFEKIENCNLKF